jgi:hypothetical protein
VPQDQQFPTAVQEIALNLVFAIIGESRINRTAREYADIAARLPPLKVLAHQVNAELHWMHQRSARSGVPLPQLCRFKAGDQRYTFEDYPREISQQTLRTALVVSGLRLPRGKRDLNNCEI